MRRGMVAWLLTVMFFVLRHLLPVLIRAIFAGTLFMLTSLVALWRGLRPSIDAMAGDWTEQLVRRMHDTQHTEIIFHLFQWVAAFTLALGWVMVAGVTVWFLNIIF